VVHEIKAPSVGESITEVRIARWSKETGQAVRAGEVLLEIESDKATVEVAADHNGVLKVMRGVGDTVKIGEILGTIDPSQAGAAVSSAPMPPVAASAPASPSARVAPASSDGVTPHLVPSVHKLVAEHDVDVSQVAGTGKHGRITTEDVKAHISKAPVGAPAPARAPVPSDSRERRVPMTLLRQKIAERLVHAQHTAAILTTFNEVDMGPVMELRSKHKEAFKTKNGVSLGFMSFFTRAVVEALKEIPAVNAMIDGKDIVYRDYFDIGVAVGTDRGLVVPVLRNAGVLDFAGIEKGIAALAEKAKLGKLSIPELSGGTFTISNGGVYGSLLSTPILNPPQSGILGMHKIQERPMVVNGQVVARPMMYLALSYDHRIIDGKEAVTFLIRVKEGLESPQEKLGFRV
jgi:2-oxoglutarate dehydrogenase E2 component (dihydrolipoamide succinyltransferase)